MGMLRGGLFSISMSQPLDHRGFHKPSINSVMASTVRQCDHSGKQFETPLWPHPLKMIY